MSWVSESPIFRNYEERVLWENNKWGITFFYATFREERVGNKYILVYEKVGEIIRRYYANNYTGHGKMENRGMPEYVRKKVLYFEKIKRLL